MKRTVHFTSQHGFSIRIQGKIYTPFGGVSELSVGDRVEVLALTYTNEFIHINGGDEVWALFPEEVSNPQKKGASMRKYGYWKHVTNEGKELWYWHRKAKGRIVSDSGQGYSSKNSVLRAIASDAGEMEYCVADITEENPGHMTIWFRHNVSTVPGNTKGKVTAHKTKPKFVGKRGKTA